VNGSFVEHIPVLSTTLVEQIHLPRDGVMVDATIGQGGHSYLFGKELGPEGMILGLDVDDKSIQRAQLILKDLTCRVILTQANFADVDRQVLKYGIEKVNLLLADLGASSSQLADEERGLSFQQDMPLDMRFDQRQKTTAAEIVNKTDEKALADLIYRFGEERASRRIARFIVKYRRTKPIKTTGQLANIVCRALGRKRSRIHPATRTFQALRIAVNHELENLQALLSKAPALLADGGYIAVISFHSLEDRLVKNDFLQNAKSGLYEILTKKPLTPGREEIKANPRAHSAKLRIARGSPRGPQES
jgi:16S rRNA (cytosine1402-N4)-methyltransferase